MAYEAIVKKLMEQDQCKPNPSPFEPNQPDTITRDLRSENDRLKIEIKTLKKISLDKDDTIR